MRTTRTYWNSRKKLFSLQTREDTGAPRRVTGYATSIYMQDVVFIVSRAGYDRAQKSGVKNVHAYVRGEMRYHTNPGVGKDERMKTLVGLRTLLDPISTTWDDGYLAVRYSPWHGPPCFCTYVDGHAMKVSSAEACLMFVERGYEVPRVWVPKGTELTELEDHAPYVDFDLKTLDPVEL